MTSMGPIRRVAMLCAHTSPLDQPGTGDAGGMNVYVRELARRLAGHGVEVEVFTRATSRHQPPTVHADPGVLVHHVPAGPFEGIAKSDLPAQMCAFVREILRTDVARGTGWFDVVHSHYWLSGQAGSIVSQRWSVPLVHSMHTMAKVKNARLATGDTPEPMGRVHGEEDLVRCADRLIANTDVERRELIELYGADPRAVDVVNPGVDLEVFGRKCDVDRRPLIVFAGRIQPLKAPDIVLEASARLHAHGIDHRVAIIGGASGPGTNNPQELQRLATRLGIAHAVEFVPTQSQRQLASWYSRASVVCVPSFNESFGLVALEAQACGTPVVAARVGGLSTAVIDGRTGTLVDSHRPDDFAAALKPYVSDVRLRELASARAARHAARFGWESTAARTVASYDAARFARARELSA
jgi:D-inositol-3-phosphate glycosyltransferase